jgi:hypothetical protein
MFLWKGTLLPNDNHLPFHPPPPPFLQAKDVNVRYEIVVSGRLGTFYNFLVSTLEKLLVFLLNYAHYTTLFYYEKVR